MLGKSNRVVYCQSPVATVSPPAQGDLEGLFFELLQVSIGNRERLSRGPSAEEWEELYRIAKEQTVAGVCFYGVKRLPAEQQPPKMRRRQWAVKAMKTEEKNKKVSAECRWICNAFDKAGFDSIILKGQGNAANYELQSTNVNIGYLRTSGDIDVWVRPKDRPGYQPVRRVIEYCQSVRKGDFVYYHNMDFPVLKETPVEVHYRPSFLFCPWRERRLQKWMSSQFVAVDYDGYKIPTREFNVVFQLLHIYKHLFEEGIGLRQMLDYYFTASPPALSRREGAGEQMGLKNADTIKLLRSLGLSKFAGAVMYVLREVFGMKEEDMICPVNEKEGRVLLSEIMTAGNFGQHDDRFDFAGATNGSMQFRGWSYAWMRLKRNFMFVRSYPMEVLFEPPFRVVHWAWRTFKLWRV